MVVSSIEERTLNIFFYSICELITEFRIFKNIT